jgi:hypothetical protein
MVLSGDRFYVLNQSGDTVILRASPKFEVIAVNSVGNELTNATLAVSDENSLSVLTRTFGALAKQNPEPAP